jgi:hypothetical protein
MYAKNPRWFLNDELAALRESVARLVREKVAPRAAATFFFAGALPSFGGRGSYRVSARRDNTQRGAR